MAKYNLDGTFILNSFGSSSYVNTLSLITTDNFNLDTQIIINTTKRQDDQSYFYSLPKSEIIKFTLPVNFVNSVFIAQIQEWWNNGTKLRFVYTDNLFSVRISNIQYPFNSYEKNNETFMKGFLRLSTVYSTSSLSLLPFTLDDIYLGTLDGTQNVLN